MGGAKCKGALIKDSASKEMFSPLTFKINFIVQSETALRTEADSLGIPRTIGSGIITYLADIFVKHDKNVV